MEWQLKDAKNHFSKVVQKALKEGPQTVILRGERAAVVLSAADYDALAGNQPNIVEDLLSGPAWDDVFVDAVNTRAKHPSRDPMLFAGTGAQIINP
ncbi:type II toxin-antitoxin system Phd/YefM family antitoxin [Brucella sp. IR073]|uniref:type II toxin-antitoxin system Phd/YefM family antitoxin n=1 Tax=unclassified Brucella TaxID=2632610 RepID=UPI003B980725